MKIKCYGGPFDGKEFTVSRYLPEWQIPYPFTKFQDRETIETYRQYYHDMYQWVGSRPYYPPKLRIDNG